MARAVFTSCLFILKAHFVKVFQQSVAMGTIYAVVSSVVMPFLNLNLIFNIFSVQKHIKRYQKQRNIYLYDIYNSSKKCLHFPINLNLLAKSKIAAILTAILDDVTDPQQRHNP